MGYQTYKEPTARNIGELTGLAIAPTVITRGMKSVRVRKGYKTALKDIQGKFGKNSKQVKEFKDMWKRAFEELPRTAGKTGKEWSPAQVKEGWGDPKIQSIIKNVLREYKPEIIGSTTIKPQTTLKKLPRGKAGDIDIQNVPALISRSRSKRLAAALYKALKKAKYNVQLRENKFVDGTTKYHITLKKLPRGKAGDIDIQNVPALISGSGS